MTDAGGAGLRAGAAIALTAVTLGGAIALSAVRSRKTDQGITLAGISHSGDLVIPAQSLQWWPESISDSIAVGWNEKNIPGASHSVMQWGANGGRTIAFTVKLTRNMRYLEDFQSLSPFGGGVPLSAKLINPDLPRNVAFNVDVRQMVKYLRAYCYPDYDGEAGQAVPPVICIVNVPGMSLNEDGSDHIFSVMTGCDVNYTKAFPDGKPRAAEVSLVFKQVVQSADGVRYKSRKQILDGLTQAAGLNPLSILTGGQMIKVARDTPDGFDPTGLQP